MTIDNLRPWCEPDQPEDRTRIDAVVIGFKTAGGVVTYPQRIPLTSMDRALMKQGNTIVCAVQEKEQAHQRPVPAPKPEPKGPPSALLQYAYPDSQGLPSVDHGWNAPNYRPKPLLEFFGVSLDWKKQQTYALIGVILLAFAVGALIVELAT
tara:strand:+ start:374 stop:829 length:456 start_codon:yes stop_codon:yes gene_type:complete